MADPNLLSQSLKYGTVGVINTSVDIAIFVVLVHALQLSVGASNIISFSCGAINSYLLNRYWTFSESRRRYNIAIEFSGFLIVTMFGLTISTIVVLIFSASLGPLVAKIISVACTFCATFFLNRKLVFHG